LGQQYVPPTIIPGPTAPTTTTTTTTTTRESWPNDGPDPPVSHPAHDSNRAAPIKGADIREDSQASII